MRKYCKKRKVFSLALKDDRVEQCLRSILWDWIHAHLIFMLPKILNRSLLQSLCVILYSHNLYLHVEIAYTLLSMFVAHNG